MSRCPIQGAWRATTGWRRRERRSARRLDRHDLFTYVRKMANAESPLLVTDLATGAVTKHAELSGDEIGFSVRMALRGAALSGTLRRERDQMKDAIARAVVEHFRTCGYRVLGKIGETEQMNYPRKHLWVDLE